jgi:hypothetical protein
MNGASREEHELLAGSVGCVAHIVHGIAVCHQRRLDLVPLPKAKG